MSWAQKLSLAAVLCLGVIITVFCVIRIIVTNTTGRQPEISWIALWSSIESSIADMVACLASFKVFLTTKRRGTRTPYSGLSGGTSAGNRAQSVKKSTHDPSSRGTGDKYFADGHRTGTMGSAHHVNSAQETELQLMGVEGGKDWRDITVTRTITVSGGADAELNFGFGNGDRETWPEGIGKATGRRKTGMKTMRARSRSCTDTKLCCGFGALYLYTYLWRTFGGGCSPRSGFPKQNPNQRDELIRVIMTLSLHTCAETETHCLGMGSVGRGKQEVALRAIAGS